MLWSFMDESRPIYPLSAVRAVALQAQELAARGQSPPPTLEDLVHLVEGLGCIQIDTLQMVHRSQYLVLWSRLGSYAVSDLDRLIYDPQARQLFEYWAHAASIIPLNAYRYYLPRMHHLQQTEDTWNMRQLSQDGNADLVQAVFARIQEEGALRAADFEKPEGKAGTWWDWKPAKRALEHLFDQGHLMIAGRKHFQRIYDVRERVLPAWVDQTLPSPEETDRYFVEQAALALGICRPEQLATYYYRKQAAVKPYIQSFLDEGRLRLVRGRLADGQAYEMIVHQRNFPLLEQAADGALTPVRTTFLSPFDSLFWAQGRDLQFWEFRKALEAYTPAHKRLYGYFCLPILHQERLIGRFDPKLERKAQRLRIKALYLEPGIQPEEHLVAETAGAMRDFLAFHKAHDLVIERSHPAEFGEKLMSAL
jgi:uncharacterized protein YcaQ